MQRTTCRVVSLGLTTLVAGATLGGCVYHREAVPAAAPTTVVITSPAQRAVTSPEGRYELRGDGSSLNPYVWVWVPTGPVPPAPPTMIRVR